MQRTISYINRLNPSRAGQLPQEGSFFGADVGVPALWRGPATGFTLSALVRGNGLDYQGNDAVPDREIIAGSREFTAQQGWLLWIEEGSIMNLEIGDGSLRYGAGINAAGKDMLVTCICDVPNDNYTMLINGDDVTASIGGGITYAQGPANLGIGGSLDPTFTPANWPVADSGGIWFSALAGIWICPDQMTADEYINHYEQSMSAGRCVPVPTGAATDAQGNSFDTRSGIATLSDTTTAWTQDLGGSGFSLTRQGTTLSGQVSARYPQWGQAG